MFLLMNFYGCKKDKNEDEDKPDNEFEISEKAKFIDNSVWQSAFISMDSNSYSYTFNSNLDQYHPQVGDILVSTYGEGMLRIISDVQVVNGNYLIQTTQGSLTDLILNGNIYLDTTLSIANIKSISYASEQVKLTNAFTKQTEDTLFQFDIDNLVVYDLDNDPQTEYDRIILNGGLSCNWNFLIDIKISFFNGLEEVKVGFESGEDLDLELYSMIGYQFEKEIPLATIHFSPIIVPLSIPPFAIIFTPVFELSTGISGFAEAAIITTVDQGITFDAGIHYLPATGWNTYTDFDKHFDFEPPQLTINAGAKAFIKPEFIVKVYGVVGPYVNMEGYLRLDADLFEDPWWELYGGFDMDAGVKAVIFSQVLFNVTFADLITYEVLLAQAQSGFNSPPNQPHDPYPADMTLNVDINPTLTWMCEDPDNDPLLFDIYFGNTTPPALVQSNVAEFSFSPGTLDYNTGYYWKIIAKDDNNQVTAGPVWSFATQSSGSGFGEPCPGLPSVLYEGITYNTVFIGSQCWLKENLNVGSMVLNTVNQSNNQVIEKYCYLNQVMNCQTNGGLYQWDELMQYAETPGSIGICPPGWHIPTDENWKELEAFLGMNPNELDLTGWRGSDQGTQLIQNGVTGFDALFSGIYNLGYFSDLSESGYYSTSSAVTSTNAWARTFNYQQTGVGRYQTLKANAISVRCIKN
jgi:uncharacterized protein (TIGR02145 family)